MTLGRVTKGMATRGRRSDSRIADATLSHTSTTSTRRDRDILAHARQLLPGAVSEEGEDYELEVDDEEEADDEHDELVNDMAIDDDTPEEARAEIEEYHRRYLQARTQRRTSHRDEVERRRRINNTSLGEPDRLLHNPLYNSNDTVSNTYGPHMSGTRLAREISARHFGSTDRLHGFQETPRRRTSSSGSGIDRQGRASTERREPDPSGYDRYFAEATPWTISDQRAHPGIDTARLPPVDESHEFGLGVESMNHPPARTASLNDTSSLSSESLAVRSTIPNSARRPVIEHPLHPLSLGTSVFDATERSLPAGGDIANGSLEQTSESNRGPLTDTPRSKKRKTARARATGDSALQRGTSRTPSHGDMGRRPFRRRRRPAAPTADEVPPPPLLGHRPLTRIEFLAQQQATPHTDHTESRPPLGRQARSSAPSSPGLFQPNSEVLALSPRSLSAFDAALVEAANARNERREYMPALDPISEPMRSRVIETLRQNSLHVPTEQRHLLPALEYCRTRHLIFTSELLPRTFTAQKRRDILNIFKHRAPYVPACISGIPGKPKIQYHITTSRQTFRSPSPRRFQSNNRRGGSLKKLPVEIFEHIARYCSHDTLKNMRLVNRDFENKLSNRVFGTAVVPFNLGIYGMMVHDNPAKANVDTEMKGKAGKPAPAQDYSAKEVDKGMKIFKAWGNNVRKFAMAFEVDEEQLCNHPKKGKYEHHTTFWGPYKWPHPFYSRYEIVEGLEKKADEFPCMSLALSYLKEVRELGLSLDSGLGWIAGPDISDRARLFQEKPRVFGHSHPFHDLDAKAEWARILRELGVHHKEYEVDGRYIHTTEGLVPRNAYGLYECTVHLGLGRPFLTFSDYDESTNLNNETLVFGGNNISIIPPNLRFDTNPLHHIHSMEHGTKDSPFKSAPLVPNNLTTAQKEWLLETEWAQRAFLSSYCMALTDNSQTFMNVESLIIAKLSSRYLAALQRDDFWKALPNLNSLTIKVSADFRDIQKTDSGIVEAPNVMPSKAAIPFYKLIEGHIARIKSIKTLDLGYFGGGEHEVGIFGRNQHILPAPLYDISNHSNSDIPSVVSLPYVEHLTLTNCWIAPATLISLVQMATPEMRTLTLKSVSMTTHYAGNERDPNPLGNGVFAVPNGLPRLYDPAVGNLWAHRRYTPDPDAQKGPNHWLVTGGRKGSWRDVIDKITPGPTIDLLRYAYQHIESAPEMRSGPLERINFVSCGYVRLPNQQELDQDGIGEVIVRPSIATLEKRAMDLIPVMMHRNTDLLLGQIVPSLAAEELAIFRDCFPMTVGWGNDDTKYHNHEDGQPTGGSGRFSGHVKKLIFADDRAVVDVSLLTARQHALQNRNWASLFSSYPRVDEEN